MKRRAIAAALSAAACAGALCAAARADEPDPPGLVRGCQDPLAACDTAKLDLLPLHRFASFAVSTGYARFTNDLEVLDASAGALLFYRRPASLFLTAGIAGDHDVGTGQWHAAFEGGAELFLLPKSTGLVDFYIPVSLRLHAGDGPAAFRYSAGAALMFANLAGIAWRPADVLYTPATSVAHVAFLSFGLFVDVSSLLDTTGAWKTEPQQGPAEHAPVELVTDALKEAFGAPALRQKACSALTAALGEPAPPVAAARRRRLEGPERERQMSIDRMRHDACPGAVVDDDDVVGHLLQQMATTPGIEAPSCAVLKKDIDARNAWKQHLHDEMCAACQNRSLRTRNGGLPYPSDLWTALECRAP